MKLQELIEILQEIDDDGLTNVMIDVVLTDDYGDRYYHKLPVDDVKHERETGKVWLIS